MNIFGKCSVHLQANARDIDRLKKTLDLRSNVDVFQEALTVLTWVAGEVERGRLILSTDTGGGNVERLTMRYLPRPEPRNPYAAVAQYHLHEAWERGHKGLPPLSFSTDYRAAFALGKCSR